MPVIYIVGAQCTGKTTLVQALSDWLRHNVPGRSFTTIQETARMTLQLNHFTRDDVLAGGERCLELQKLIFYHQLEKERESRDADIVIADRSGLDPLVYASMYCGEQSIEGMFESQGWTEMKSAMIHGTVIVCEPVAGWLFDDGVRLMPNDVGEWMATHDRFCEILRSIGIPFTVLPSSITSLEKRVDFVLTHSDVK